MPTRNRAAIMLGRIGRKADKSVPVFIGFLTSRRSPKDPQQHAELLFSLKALTMLGPTAKDATPELIRLVKDAEWSAYVRAAAMEAWGSSAASLPSSALYTPVSVTMKSIGISCGCG